MKKRTAPSSDLLDLTEITLFVRAATLGHLSAAGRELGLAPASASARLAQLEARLGVRLLHRTTRQISLTPDGEIFLTHARQLLDTAEAAHASVGKGEQSPRGVLRVTMPSSFGRQHVSPLIPDFLARHPDLSVDLRLSDHVVDLVEDGMDCAIRVGELKDSSLVARKLAVNRRVICASPDYLARRGTPQHPADLAAHDCLVLAGQNPWHFDTPAGPVQVRIGGRLTSDSGEAIRDAAVAGVGIALQSIWNLTAHLRRGELIVLLPAYPVLPDTGVWALYPSRAFVPARTRAFIDFLVERFGKTPDWDRLDNQPGNKRPG